MYYSFVLCDASFNSWNNQKYLFRKKIKIKTKSYAYNSFSCPSSSRYEMVFYIYTVKPDDHLSCIGGRWCIENKHRLRFLSRWPPVYVYYTQCVHLEHIACQGRCEMGEVEIRLSLFTRLYGWLLFFWLCSPSQMSYNHVYFVLSIYFVVLPIWIGNFAFTM